MRDGGDTRDAAFWKEVEEIFAAVVDATTDQRRAQLDVLCEGQPALRSEVESLLASHDRASTFLDRDVLDPLVGTTVAGFRLKERIGRGGMGVVYLAERVERDFTQRAAVKLIATTLRHEDVARQFQAERQLLARLNHPNVVTLLDAGVTPEGQPYLVMEHVDGVPVTTFCANTRLALEARVRLVQQICAAIHDAHRHGVVHRDLKPANVLVTAAGVAKVLDFGIAKLLDATGEVVDPTIGPLSFLTPNYASPEQVRGLPATTASDLYSLGVMLFEVLTGTRPYDFSGQTLDRILTVLQDGATRPSVASPSSEAAPPYPIARLRGDLDAIVGRAMHPEPTRRYGSAQELSNDLERFLTGRPVEARNPSAAYVLTRLASRHRVAFVAGGLAALAIVAALGLSLWQTRVARAARERAEHRFDDARQLANAVIFGIHDELLRVPGSTAARQKIAAEALAYLERLSQDPAGDASFRIELARAYYRVGYILGAPGVSNLGDGSGALASYEKAIAILDPLAERGSAAAEASRWLAEIHVSRAQILDRNARSAEASASVDAAVSIAERLAAGPLPSSQARRLLANVHFARAQRAAPDRALDSWQRAGAMYESLLRDTPGDRTLIRNLALVAKYTGAVYETRADFATSAAHHRRALELDLQLLALDPSNTLARGDVAIDLGNLAFAEWQTGNRAAAAEGYERSLEIRRQLAAEDTRDVRAQTLAAYAALRLAAVYSEVGRHADALRVGAEGMTFSRNSRDVDRVTRIEHANNLARFGRINRVAGRPVEACRAVREAAAILADVRRTRDEIAANQRAREAEGVIKTELPLCVSRTPEPVSTPLARASRSPLSRSPRGWRRPRS